MSTELKREEFFKRFQQSGSIDDLLDPAVRSEVENGFFAVKVDGKIFKTKGQFLLDKEK